MGVEILPDHSRIGEMSAVGQVSPFGVTQLAQLDCDDKRDANEDNYPKTYLRIHSDPPPHNTATK
jgi:hypothetical protein